MLYERTYVLYYDARHLLFVGNRVHVTNSTLALILIGYKYKERNRIATIHPPVTNNHIYEKQQRHHFPCCLYAPIDDRN